MSACRIVYLATADARGHLMRAQLLTHALRARGAEVDVLTTSEEGIRFLAGFGITARLLSLHYAVQFDSRQNMLRGATDANVAAYLFHPGRMLRDIWRLRSIIRHADMIINDSFHPALLCMGSLPGWRRKVVHIYGVSLRLALETNFVGRVPGWLAGIFRRIIALQLARSRARLEHDFAYAELRDALDGGYQLPTPVAVVSGGQPARRGEAHSAAVYLNPHFCDPALAAALERGLDGAGVLPHLVGEGYAARSGWIGQDPAWVERAVCSELIVSAPGMAALSIALLYRRPILLVLTDQPEQQNNASRAARCGVLHRTIVWRGDAQAFAEEASRACRELLENAQDSCPGGERHAAAATRVQNWVTLLMNLAKPC